MSQQSLRALRRRSIAEVGEATMASKHEVPCRSQLSRRTKSTSQNPIQFQPPVILGQDKSFLSRVKYFEPKEARGSGTLEKRKKTQHVANGLKLIGEVVLEQDMEPVVRERRQSQGRDGGRRMQGARTELGGLVSIGTLHQKFLFALKLLRKQKSYSEAIVLITDIDDALKSMASSQDVIDHVVLHQLVSKQLGLCLETKAQCGQAIEHFERSIELCRKLQRLNPRGGGSNLEIEMCENMFHICKCRWKLKQIEQTQEGIREITQRAQTIVDNEDEDGQDSERIQRAILVHASASKLQGDILEQHGQHQQAHEIFLKAKTLLTGVFQQAQSPASAKLLQQLSRSLYRTKLTIKYVQSNTPTLDLLSQQVRNKKDAVLKSNLTSAYISKQTRPKFLDTSPSGIFPGGTPGRKHLQLSQSIRSPPEWFAQTHDAGRLETGESVLAVNDKVQIEAAPRTRSVANMNFKAYQIQGSNSGATKKESDLGAVATHERGKKIGSKPRDFAPAHKTRSEAGEQTRPNYEILRRSGNQGRNAEGLGAPGTKTTERASPAAKKGKILDFACLSDVQIEQKYSPIARTSIQRVGQMEFGGYQSTIKARTTKKDGVTRREQATSLHNKAEVQTEKAYQRKERSQSNIASIRGKKENPREQMNQQPAPTVRMSKPKQSPLASGAQMQRTRQSIKENKRYQDHNSVAEDSPFKSNGQNKMAKAAATEKSSPTTKPAKKGPMDQIRDSIERYKSYIQSRSAFSPQSLKAFGDARASPRSSKPMRFAYPAQRDASDRATDHRRGYAHTNSKKNPGWLNSQSPAYYSNLKFPAVRSEYYFDKFGKRNDRRQDPKQNNSVSYQGKTSAGDGDHVVSQRRMSDTFSAIQSWQVIATSHKDQIAVLKHIQMQKANTTNHRAQSVGKDGKNAKKSLSNTRMNSKSKSKSKKGSRSRSRKKVQLKAKKSQRLLRQPRPQRTERAKPEPPLINIQTEAPEANENIESEKQWEQTPQAKEIEKIDHEAKASEASLGRRSNDLLLAERSPRSIEDNIFKRRRGSSLGEDSLHPNQNLQSEGPDLEPARSSSVVKTLAHQVEELRSEQRQQKDILNLVLEKQNLLNQQLDQSKQPLKLPVAAAGRPGERPDTANFGIMQKEVIQALNSSERVTQAAKKEIHGPSRFKNKEQTPKQDQVVDDGPQDQLGKSPTKPKQTTKQRKLAQQTPQLDPTSQLSSKRLRGQSPTKNKKTNKGQTNMQLDSAIMLDAAEKAPMPSADVEADERVQTASTFKMPYKDGRLLIFKTQRLNKTRRAIEDLSIYADFFEDHQVTLSLRVFSKKERRELSASRKDLVYILYGQICMSSNEFRDLCKVYVSQISWKSDTLEEYIQCLKMVVRVAIEKKDQKIKITEQIVDDSKIVYKVIQKAQFSEAPSKPEVSIVKDLDTLRREQSAQQLMLHNYKVHEEAINESQERDQEEERSDNGIKIIYQGEQQAENLANAPVEAEEEEVERSVPAATLAEPKNSILPYEQEQEQEEEEEEEDRPSTVLAAGSTRTDPEEPETQRPIHINDRHEEVVVDLAAFLKDTLENQDASLQVADSGAGNQPDINKVSAALLEAMQRSVANASRTTKSLMSVSEDESLTKAQRLQTLLLEAERLVISEEFRRGESESEQTEPRSLNRSYPEFLSSITKNGKTIRLIIKENASQEQFKIKLRCEKDHVKIIAVNLNVLQEQMLPPDPGASGGMKDSQEVQVFQKLDYDEAALNLVKRQLKDMEPLQLQQFFKRSLKIISKTDGEIQDILIQEDKHVDENVFMDSQVFIEAAEMMRTAYGVGALNIFESHLEVSEAKYSKAAADKLLQVLFAALKIKTALQRHSTAKRLRQVVQAKVGQEKYIARAEEQQQMRSNSSRDGDPILPENASEAACRVSRQGMFLSQVNKNYAFYYKIHSAAGNCGDCSASSGLYCWSFYVKILGSRTVTIWQYHRFADDILDQVEESRAKKADDPCDLLKIFVEKIGKQTADLILREAEDEKADFAVEHMQAPGQPKDAGGVAGPGVTVNDIALARGDDLRKKKAKQVKLTPEEKRSWEVFWIQNLRQQLHLEL